MIDALAGGQVIRKRKYRRENTMIGYKWYDYNGVEVIDPIEISRLDSLATKHQRVDQAYDDHAVSCHQPTTSIAYPVSLWTNIWLW